jgi:hypothetical protein
VAINPNAGIIASTDNAVTDIRTAMMQMNSLVLRRLILLDIKLSKDKITA